jgi:hypothetical protein
MKASGKYSQVWVNLAIGSGILVGLLLLIQTISTYFFVYGRIVHDEALQEVGRKEAAIARTANLEHVTDVHRLGPVLRELRLEAPKQIAWMRILDMDSHVLAQTGQPLVKLPTPDQLRQSLVLHQPRSNITHSSSGDILVVVSRMRLPRPEPPKGFDPRRGPPPRDDLAFTEIAIYVDSVNLHLGALRQNLIIGCLAAIVLLSSMLSIWLLFRRYIRARELEQQVELARSVQADLLPSAESRKPSRNLEFAAAFFPAATVGGDFYDVFTADDGQISIVLGDVAGKGISAALLMGVLHGAIRSLNGTRSAADQERGGQWLNRFLCEKTARERFVSLFWAYYLPGTGELRYINAGHLPPLLVRSSGVEKLESGGPVLGVLPLATYTSGTVQVDAGDILIVFSDGVAEALNAKDEEFGEGRISEIACRNIERSPQQICDAILTEVNVFLGGLKAHDDQTLLIVRLTPALKPELQPAFQDSTLQELA